jgi:hypothetical protein
MGAGYFGKYTGIVVDNRDAENLGQLEVQVPAIFGPETVVTARPALPYGVFFVPETNNKVWIEFEGGDSGRPLWTGVQYVAGEWPAEAQAIPPERRLIKMPSGHYLLFSDRNGEESVVLFSNTYIRIKSLGTVEIDAPNVVINGRLLTPSPRPL